MKTNEWQVAIDQVIKLCDEMMEKEDVRTAAAIAVLRERLLKLKKGK